MAQGTGAQGLSVGSLLLRQPPSSDQMSGVACESSETIVFVVPELVMSEKVPASTARMSLGCWLGTGRWMCCSLSCRQLTVQLFGYMNLQA